MEYSHSDLARLAPSSRFQVPTLESHERYLCGERTTFEHGAQHREGTGLTVSGGKPTEGVEDSSEGLPQLKPIATALLLHKRFSLRLAENLRRRRGWRTSGGRRW